MPYKTIVLELLQRNPNLYETLRSSRALLAVLDSCALELKTRHAVLRRELARTTPHIDASQITNAAMEIAVQEMESRLQAVSLPDGQEALSLEDAVAFIRNPTSRD